MIETKILNVIPTYNWELIFHLNDDSYRLIELLDLRNYDLFRESVKDFNHFKFNATDVVWKNGCKLNIHHVSKIAKPVVLRDLENKSLFIGQTNKAPTEKHKLNHVYFASLYPYAPKPMMIGETIGYGHGASGGCATYTFESFRKFKPWKDHLKKAGCDWVISIIERDDLTAEQKVLKIVERIRNGINTYLY